MRARAAAKWAPLLGRAATKWAPLLILILLLVSGSRLAWYWQLQPGSTMRRRYDVDGQQLYVPPECISNSTQRGGAHLAPLGLPGNSSSSEAFTRWHLTKRNDNQQGGLVSTQFSIVITAQLEQAGRLFMLLASLRKYVQTPTEVNAIYVIVSDAEGFAFREALSYVFPFRLLVLPASQLSLSATLRLDCPAIALGQPPPSSGSTIRRAPAVVRGVCKRCTDAAAHRDAARLLVARRVRTEFYLSLDPGCVLRRPLTLQSLVKGHRATYNQEAHGPALPWRGSAAVLGLSASRCAAEAGGKAGVQFGGTPAVLATNISLLVIHRLVEVYGPDFELVLYPARGPATRPAWCEHAMYALVACHYNLFHEYHQFWGHGVYSPRDSLATLAGGVARFNASRAFTAGDYTEPFIRYPASLPVDAAAAQLAAYLQRVTPSLSASPAVPVQTVSTALPAAPMFSPAAPLPLPSRLPSLPADQLRNRRAGPPHTARSGLVGDDLV